MKEFLILVHMDRMRGHIIVTVLTKALLPFVHMDRMRGNIIITVLTKDPLMPGRVVHITRIHTVHRTDHITSIPTDRITVLPTLLRVFISLVSELMKCVVGARPKALFRRFLIPLKTGFLRRF
jgi:hypothetical protein